MRNFRIALFLVMSAVLVSCSRNSNEPKKKSIHLNLSKKPTSLDPRKICDSSSSALQFLIGEGLTRMDEDSTTTPALAQKIEISEDGRVYTFHMRKAHWSDGSRITAHDVARTWLKVLDPMFPSMSANLLYSIQGAYDAKRGLAPVDDVGIVVIDDSCLRVTLTSPTPYFLEIISFAATFPIAEKMEDQIDGLSMSHPEQLVTSGPFRIVKNHPDDGAIFEKNPNYWKADEVLLDQIHVSFIDNETTVLGMFERSEVDLIGAVYTYIPQDALLSLSERDLLTKKEVASVCDCYLNTRIFPFNNQHFRRAFALAINRQEIVDHVTQMGELAATSYIGPALKDGYVSKFYQDDDIEEAKRELALGFKETNTTIQDLKNIPYLHTASDLGTSLAQTIQSQLKKNLDIDIKLVGREFKVFLSLTSHHEFTMAQSGWIVQYNDQMNMLERFQTATEATNFTGWENESYKELLRASNFCQNRKERLAILESAEQILMDEMPVIPYYHRNYIMMINPKMKGLYVSPIGSFHFNRVDLEDESFELGETI